MNLVKSIVAPAEVVNDEFVNIVKIHVQPGEKIRPNDALVDIETSKSIITIESEWEGYVEILHGVDSEVRVGETIINIWDNRIESMDAEKPKEEEPATVFSEEAERIIAELGLQRSLFSAYALVSAKEVRNVFYQNVDGIDLQYIKENLKHGSTNILMIGSTAHANTLMDILERENNLHIVGVITHDISKIGNFFRGYKIISSEQQMTPSDLENLQKVGVSLVFGYSFKDKRLCSKRASLLRLLLESGIDLYNVIHKSAVIEPSAIIGKGNQMAANAVIGSSVQLGHGNIINTSAVVSHNCVIKNNVHIAPGAILGGGVTVGNNVLVGMNATIYADVTIPDDTFIQNNANILPKDKLTLINCAS